MSNINNISIECPYYINEYITYLRVIKGSSERTVQAYYGDICLFLKYIKMTKLSVPSDTLFEDISDLDFFFLQLQQELKVPLYERNSVIIFDEVQLQPLARQAIKHLVKDGRYDYIETGSLLTLKKYVQNIIIPSEESWEIAFPTSLAVSTSEKAANAFTFIIIMSAHMSAVIFTFILTPLIQIWVLQ